MENDLIKERVQQALDCVQGLDEPYRGIAFQVILKELLREGIAPAKRVQRLDHPPKSFPPINEFFSAVHPKAYTDAVITIAYHLLHGEKVQTFTIQDMAECLSKCRAEKPKNLSDVLGWLCAKRLVGGRKSEAAGNEELVSDLDRRKVFSDEIKSGGNERRARGLERLGIKKVDEILLHGRKPRLDRLIGIDGDLELSIREAADPPGGCGAERNNNRFARNAEPVGDAEDRIHLVHSNDLKRTHLHPFERTGARPDIYRS